MLDPLTALNIATAVCQFVDSGASLLSCAWKIYQGHAADDTTTSFVQEVEQFNTITETLRSVQNDEEARSRRALDARGRTRMNGQSDNGAEEFGEADKKLLKFLKDCEKLASTFRVLAAKFAVKGDPNALQSLRLAIKMKFHREELERCGKQLDKQKAELATYLSTVLWSRSGSVMTVLRNLQEKDDAMHLTLTSRLDDIKSEILQLSNSVSGSNAQLASRLASFKEETEKVSKTQYFLSAFQYDAMRIREDAVPRRHAETFSWIFEDVGKPGQSRCVPRGFPHWLRRDSGVFWISGKAGSGKSTLMKYLYENDATQRRLQHWAKGKKLVVSRHFFWLAGTSLQKSQSGLLRSLCYDIFRHCPDLVPKVLKHKWATLSTAASLDVDPTATARWSQAELSDTFEKICAADLTSDGKEVFFAFFIDGLDEYEGPADDLIEILRGLSAFRNVKLCVSSRPWNAFAYAFGKDPSRMLVLQDLTRDDIASYVRDKLEADERFLRLKMRDSRCMAIVEEITTKAQGVFLWVVLIIRELMKSLTNDDNFANLQRRLRLMPPDLESYFRHMFDHLDSFYQYETAQIFRVMLEAPQYVPLLAFAVLEGDDPIAIRVSGDVSSEAPRHELLQLSARLQSRIQGRVYDLLEIRNGTIVDFLHRTVRDFLMTGEISALLDQRTGPDFDIDETACKMSLVSLRYLNHFLSSSTPDTATFEWMLPAFFEHARAIEDKQHRAPSALIRAMQTLLADLDDAFIQELPNGLNLLAAMSLPLSLEDELVSQRIAKEQADDLLYSALTYIGIRPDDAHAGYSGGALSFSEMSWKLDPERRGFRLEIIDLLLAYDASEQKALRTAVSMLVNLDSEGQQLMRPVFLKVCKQLVLAGARLNNVSECVSAALGASNTRWLLDLQPPKNGVFRGLIARWLPQKG